MRTTRTLAIAAALGLGLASVASANVVYDSETTNDWFKANVATSSELTSPPWTKPSKGGDAVVKGASNAHYIALDTDLDDPLTYAAADSADVAVVAAEMTATVNATAPQITADPQAALAVVGDATAAKWAGLVGKEGGGTEWVTFPNPIPVVGNSYSVRIEFDQRPGEARRIRYLVDGVVLSGTGSSGGWYPNPQADAAKISNVSFSGSGDIKALAGESITENTIAFNAPTETDGYDYTNGTISVSADIQGYENVTATLTVTGGTDDEKVTVVSQTPGSADWSWGLNGLTQGGIYSYTIEAKDAGGNVIATKTGTLTAANWPANIWFGADASKSTLAERVKGGSWATEEPQIEGNAYAIEDDALFNVTDQNPGSNHVTRVDTKVTFETLVDSSSLEIPEDVALGGFVAAKAGENPQWMALTAGTVDLEWVVLTGDIVPEVNRQYVIRAEIDFISNTKRVRFLVSADEGAFLPLSNGTSQWIDLATQEKYSLAAVELKGSGKVAKFEATVADKALAVVDGVEYDSMEEAFEAAGTNGEYVITLLTNATVDPTEPGSYDIAPGGHHYASGGQISTDTTSTKTIVVDESGEPVVRPSTATMKEVKTPDDKSYKNINSLRTFLEKNGVEAYTKNGNATAIDNALKVPGKNGLPLWEDYVMGIDPKDSVTPEYTPSEDEDPENFSLQVPALADATPSGDYAIKYKINQNDPVTMPDTGIIPVALPAVATDFDVKIILEPAPVSE